MRYLSADSLVSHSGDLVYYFPPQAGLPSEVGQRVTAAGETSGSPAPATSLENLSTWPTQDEKYQREPYQISH